MTRTEIIDAVSCPKCRADKGMPCLGGFTSNGRRQYVRRSNHIERVTKAQRWADAVIDDDED